MADISKIKLPNGSEYNLKDSGALRNGRPLFTTNPFAPTNVGSSSMYISKIDNGLYASDKRFDAYITIDGNTSTANNVFDGSYESVTVIPAGKTGVLTVDFSEQSGSRFPGYPYGYIYVSFYYSYIPASVTGRVYNNYEAHTIGWSDLSFVRYAPDGGADTQHVYTARQSKYGLQILEISITAPANKAAELTQVEIWLDRPHPKNAPFVSKYTEETLYYDLTAPKFIGNLTGNVTGNATNVTGTVAIANGGTGATTAAGAANAVFSGLPTWTADPTDDTYLPRQDTGGSASYGKVKFSTVWNYIKGKISSILGLTATNYGGTSAKATADASGNTITSYYAPKSTAVTNVALATNKITKTINGSTTDVVTAATTSAYGITKLNSATNSTSTTEAATPSAVKTAYDLANSANTTANTALSGVNGTLIYDHTYTISNGVATFTPHVYQKGVEVTTNYAKSCFVWKYKLASNMSSTPSYVTLTTNNDRTCTVNISTLGYGGYVLGEFTPA